MTTFIDQVKILRRFLRDPNGDVWSIEDLALYWSDASMEVGQRTGFVERAKAMRYPPSYTWSYLYDFERNYTQGDIHRALSEWEINGMYCTYPWEPNRNAAASGTPDDGYRFTHPWEGAQVGSPADVVRMPLDPAFLKSKFVAFNQLKLEPISKRGMVKTDPFYATRMGEPRSYYHPDGEGNQMVLYPRPSSATWADDTVATSPTIGLDDDYGIDLTQEGSMDYQDTGAVTELINLAGQLFMIYEATPPAIEDYDEPLTYWPEFLLRVIRYGTLESAFGANTDGFIPTLRDYWQKRKELGIKAILALKMGRMKDRDYQMGGTNKPKRSMRLRLPAGYPAQYP